MIDIATLALAKKYADDIRRFVADILDSDDATLDQLSEIVAYIKSNRDFIEAITDGKVNVSDIINELTSEAVDKPLSAAMGSQLREMIESISVPQKLSELESDKDHRTVSDTEKQSWNSKAGIHYGSDEPEDESHPIWINPNGKSTETDKSLSVEGKPADAKEVGKRFENLSGEIADLNDQILDKQQLKPEFANSIQELEQSGDTTKLYVLPDGYIYAYMETRNVTEGCTNYADKSSADWATGKRISSSNGTLASNNTTDVTNYIPCVVGDKVRFKNCTVSQSQRLAFYDADKNYLGMFAVSTLISSSGLTVDSETGITTYHKVGSTGQSNDTISSLLNTAYVRFCVDTGSIEPIITVNEEIVVGTITQGYQWTNTGRSFVSSDYEDRIVSLEEQTGVLSERVGEVEEMIASGLVEDLPSYWLEHLDNKIASIKALHDVGGKDCFSFVVITDIHYESNLAKRSPLLAKKIVEECGIKYVLCLGDTQTRHGANHDEAYIENEWLEIERMLSPIRDRLLITQGNHDGSYGIIDENNDGIADDINNDGVVDSFDKNVYNYTPQQLYNRIFRKVSTINNVWFSNDGTGYYVDDTGSKVRYIILNSHVNKHELNEDGSIKYNNMHNFRFGQSQYDMVIDALNSVPSGEWSVIIGSHVPLDRTAEYTAWGGEEDENGALLSTSVADCTVMQRLLNAFFNKTSYIGSFEGTQNGFDAVSVNADFSNAKGQIIAYFGGHAHRDNALPPTYNWNGAEHSDFYTIITRSDGRTENTSELMNERVAGTITEQSFDVFTVNKTEKKIYATKIGAGSDRVISY